MCDLSLTVSTPSSTASVSGSAVNFENVEDSRENGLVRKNIEKLFPSSRNYGSNVWTSHGHQLLGQFALLPVEVHSYQ